jgi:hypothetical protein
MKTHPESWRSLVFGAESVELDLLSPNRRIGEVGAGQRRVLELQDGGKLLQSKTIFFFRPVTITAKNILNQRYPTLQA